MTRSPTLAHEPGIEHSVPWFWPFAAAVEMGGHLGLFMGAFAVADTWPGIARGIAGHDTGAGAA